MLGGGPAVWAPAEKSDRVWIIDPRWMAPRVLHTGSRDDWSVHIALRRSSAAEITDAAVALPARGSTWGAYRTDTVTSGAAPAAFLAPLRIASAPPGHAGR